METWLEEANVKMILHGAAAVLLLIACLASLAANQLNKGAKANAAWSLLTGGFLCIGLAEAGRSAGVVPQLARFDGPLLALGAALVAAGAIVWRGLIAGMRK